METVTPVKKTYVNRFLIIGAIIVLVFFFVLKGFFDKDTQQSFISRSDDVFYLTTPVNKITGYVEKADQNSIVLRVEIYPTKQFFPNDASGKKVRIIRYHVTVPPHSNIKQGDFVVIITKEDLRMNSSHNITAVSISIIAPTTGPGTPNPIGVDQ